MDFLVLLKRASLVFLIIAVAAGGTVYFFNDWFHHTFIPATGLASPLGDAIGTVLIVAATYVAQRIISMAFYRDWLFGLKNQEAQDSKLIQSHVAAADQVAAELEQVRTYNDVVRKQLELVINETEKAAFDITSRLQTIDEVVGSLSNFVNTTASESTELLAVSEQRIGRNRSLISTLERYIQDRITAAQDDQQRVAQVVQEAKSLGSLVELIKSISGQTNLLALNAAIEAARAGEAGRGFAVVADEVRKLSAATDQAVTQINHGIQAVAASIQSQFQDKLETQNIEAERTALESFAKQLDELGKSYQDVTQHETEVLLTISNSSQKLADMFVNALASVQFQDVTRQQLEQVMNALSRLDEHSAMLAERLKQFEDPHFQLRPLSEHLDQIYSSYVMSSQRQSHNDALAKGGGGGDDGGGPKVELF